MKLIEKLASTPVWLVLPSLLVAAAVGYVALGYDPLVFDPSLYEVAKANASELKTVSTEGIEKATGTPAGNVEMAGGGAAAAASGKLADGTWTGYAACGKGNSDGWKPYYVAVTVQVKSGKVKGITDVRGSSSGDSGSAALNWDAAENQKYLTWAVSGKGADAGVRDQINKLLGQSKKVSGIDMVSSATYSSAAIYNAYIAAVNKAAKAGGAKASKGKGKAAGQGSQGGSSQSVEADTAVGKLADGTWTGFAACGDGNPDEWKPYYVAVTVTVADGAVRSVDSVVGASTGDDGSSPLNWDAAENQMYLDWAVEGRIVGSTTFTGVLTQIEAAISSGANASSIDTVSGATYSSKALFEAYYAALRKSAAAAGSSIEQPADGNDAGGTAGDGSGGTAADGGGDSNAGGGNQGGQGGAGTGGDSGSGPDDGKQEEPAEEQPQEKEYTGYALCQSDGSWSSYYIIVTIKAVGDKVTQIVSAQGDADGAIDPAYKYDKKDNASYLNQAISGTPRRAGVVKQIQAKIDAGAKTVSAKDINTISSATISSKAIVEAYNNAVSSM